MPENTLAIEQILTMLAGTPARIAEGAAGLSPDQLLKVPKPGDWSANEVLAHLRSCADVWGGCVLTILQHDHPTIRAVNPRTWIKSTGYLNLEFQPSLEAFTTQRAGLLTVLKSLPMEDWNRSATITGAGKVLERSMWYYAEWLALHERPHVKQIQSIARMLHANERAAR